VKTKLVIFMIAFAGISWTKKQENENPFFNGKIIKHPRFLHTIK